MRYFGIALTLFLVANLLASKFYLRRRYQKGGSEWGEKATALERHLARRPRLDYLFVGDSTVSCGIAPGQFDPDAFNLAWSGFEPSELAALERQILALPCRPQRVIIGITPEFMAQNEWRNSFDLPLLQTTRDALGDFYRDTNSLKPFLLMGGVCALANRFLHAPKLLGPARGGAPANPVAAPWRVEPDGLLVDPQSQQPLVADPDENLHFRPVNFRMLRAFREHLGKAGIGTEWLRMPYSSPLEHTLAAGPRASAYMAEMDMEIASIFGSEVIDLRGTVPDAEFRDNAHLLPAGAFRLSKGLGIRLRQGG